MDPISAMATASAAFGAIKKGFQVGRDIEAMASDLSRWMGAMSDLDMLEKEAKNPPIFKKLFAGKSVEQEAMETFAAKQKAESQRRELQNWSANIQTKGKLHILKFPNHKKILSCDYKYVIIGSFNWLSNVAGRNQELLLWKGDQPSSGKVRLFLHFDPPTITNNKIFVKSSNQELTQIATNGFSNLIRITGTNLGDKYLGKLVFGLVSSSNGNGNRRLLSAIQRRRKLLSSTQSTVCTTGNIFCKSFNASGPEIS